MKTPVSDIRHIIQSPDLDEDTRLFRYISLSRFVDFIETKQTFLSRISDWPDTWEVPEAKLPVKTDAGTIEYSLFNIHETMYGQCWSLLEESDAMWRIYSPQNEGVVIQTSVRKFKLFEGIKFAAFGPVIYYDELKAALDRAYKLRNYDIFTGAFLKRKAFEHEKEVRFVTMNDDHCLINKPRSGVSRFNISVDPCEFIEGITIDPRADRRHVIVLQRYCERAGMSVKPLKSKLYGDPYRQTNLVRQFIPVKQ